MSSRSREGPDNFRCLGGSVIEDSAPEDIWDILRHGLTFLHMRDYFQANQSFERALQNFQATLHASPGDMLGGGGGGGKGGNGP
jgi:hypothetical protein